GARSAEDLEPLRRERQRRQLERREREEPIRREAQRVHPEPRRRGRERGEERVGLRADEAAGPPEERFREPALPARLSTGRAVPPTAPASPRDESAEPLTFAPSPARSAARALRRAAPRPGSNHRSDRKVSPHASTGTSGPNRAAQGPRGPPCSTAPWTVPRAR